jgi:hypothetical protein
MIDAPLNALEIAGFPGADYTLHSDPETAVREVRLTVKDLLQGRK